MGQKVHPIGFRLGTTENWRSRWYTDKDYKATLKSDLEIRKFLETRLKDAALSRVEIERAGDKVKVVIYTARPGIVIGKKGTEIDTLRKDIEKVHKEMWDAIKDQNDDAYRALANELTRASSALAAEWITVLGKIAVEMTDE